MARQIPLFCLLRRPQSLYQSWGPLSSGDFVPPQSHFYSTLPGGSLEEDEGKKERSFEERLEEEMNKVTTASDLFSTFTPDEKDYEIPQESAPKRFLEGVGQLFKKKPLTHQQKVDEIRRTEWLIRMAKFEMMEKVREQKEELDQKDPIVVKYSDDCEVAVMLEIRRIEERALRGPDALSAEVKTRTERECHDASVRITEEYYQKLRKDHPEIIPKPIQSIKMVEAAKEILHETLGKDYVPGKGVSEGEGGGEEGGEKVFGVEGLSAESLGSVQRGISSFH